MVLSFYEDNSELFEPWEPKRTNTFYTLSYHKTLLTAEYNQIADGKLLRYWIFLKNQPEEIIGTVCFQNLLREPYLSCSLGYKISKNHLHQGYAAEAINRCIELMFREYRMHRIDAFIMPSNIASLKLIERLGFVYEGTSNAFARINGQWADHMHYALISPSNLD
jgi:ribosomal-protein-alanine N-acetyltransferase